MSSDFTVPSLFRPFHGVPSNIGAAFCRFREQVDLLKGVFQITRRRQPNAVSGYGLRVPVREQPEKDLRAHPISLAG